MVGSFQKLKFPEHLRAYSGEQGERFHQDIKTTEQRYEERWDENMITNYYWTLKKGTSERNCEKNTTTKVFWMHQSA